MVNGELLKILRCVETQQELGQADNALMEKLNARVAAGQLRNRAGQPVQEKLEGGLLRQDGMMLYPIRNNIPIMLLDEAIPLQA